MSITRDSIQVDLEFEFKDANRQGQVFEDNLEFALSIAESAHDPLPDIPAPRQMTLFIGDDGDQEEGGSIFSLQLGSEPPPPGDETDALIF